LPTIEARSCRFLVIRPESQPGIQDNR